MVILTLTSGPYKDRSYVIDLSNAKDYFYMMIQEGWSWNIDYSNATDKEAFDVFKYELAHRILRALFKRRRVTFVLSPEEYYTWKAETDDEVNEFAGIIEDTIVNSGRTVTIDLENDKELRIIAAGWEQ